MILNVLVLKKMKYYLLLVKEKIFYKINELIKLIVDKEKILY